MDGRVRVRLYLFGKGVHAGPEEGGLEQPARLSGGGVIRPRIGQVRGFLHLGLQQVRPPCAVLVVGRAEGRVAQDGVGLEDGGEVGRGEGL